MKTVAVFAGHYRQFYSFLEEQVFSASPKNVLVYSTTKAIVDGVRYIYSEDVMRLRGIHDLEIVYYGTWTNQPQRKIDEFDEFRKYLKSKEIK